MTTTIISLTKVAPDSGQRYATGKNGWENLLATGWQREGCFTLPFFHFSHYPPGSPLTPYMLQRG
jgi:hypothetical protein